MSSEAPLNYPVTRVVNHVDVYHGTPVADPYRWLEDDNSEETAAWIQSQNKVTFGYLAKIPQRSHIREQLKKRWNFERFGPPRRVGGRCFYLKNSGLQNQSVLYWSLGLQAEPKVLLDPNTLSADGGIALRDHAISDDGKLAAYGLTASGSDWQEWHIREVDSGKDLPDVLKWVKFSGVAWTRDGKGFFYGRYDAPAEKEMLSVANYFQKLYYHRIGTPQEQDELIYKRDDEKDWRFGAGTYGATVSEDGRYLVMCAPKGTDASNQVFFKDLSSWAPVAELIAGFDNDYEFVGNDGPVFWFKTDLNAPRGRVIAVDTRQPARANWKELIPQSGDTLRSVSIAGERFVASYMKDAHAQIKIFHLDGTFEKELPLPGIGSVFEFEGKRAESETFFIFTSFTTPATVYRYDMRSGECSVYHKPNVAFDSACYETKQVFYASKDGTRIPMFITHKKGLPLDGTNATLLYGYGGFNHSLTPGFGTASSVWMEMGGIFAVANLRGGGEYGEEWHKAGTKSKRQNVVDDFIAAAEWLIANKYTSTPKLAIMGESNGGLLVGTCITQRPELYGAALPGTGVMDMLRFHKFTIGWAAIDEYGSSDDPAEFKVLRAYSPYHNVKKGTRYPATLVMTVDHDDRVVPAQSLKFGAAMQAAQAGPAPVLIRVDIKAGHGAGMPIEKLIDLSADRWAFLVKELEVSS